MYRLQSIPKRLSLIADAAKASSIVPQLMRCHEIGFDSEGHNIGRFGKLSLVQISTPDCIYICDCLQPDVLKSIAPVLKSDKVTKVMHDCREDLSNLYHEHKIFVKNVWDLQVAYKTFHNNFLASLEHVRRDLLGSTAPIETVESQMQKDSNLWLYRPVTKKLIEYAVDGVADILLLKDKIGIELEKDVMESYLNYRMINLNIRKQSDLRSVGLKVKGMLTAITPSNLVFKLNSGIVGLVSGISNVSLFEDVKIGQIVDCTVTGWNDTHDAIFLQRA